MQMPFLSCKPGVYVSTLLWIAFQADKSGGNDIYVLDMDQGAITRVTYTDGNEQLDVWSRDGQWLYFDSARDNAGRMNGVYRTRGR